MMVVVGVALVVGLLSSAIIAPTVAASEDSEGDRSMEIAGHFAQTETAPNETTASNKTATSNGTTTSNTSQASRPANASLNVDENETTPSRVSLSSVSLPANGFIVVHNESYSPASPQSDSIIGRTQYVRGGNYTDVVIDLYNDSDRKFNRSQTTSTRQVSVLVYNDSNGDSTFDLGEDTPYQNSSGYPISDSTIIEGIDTGRLASGTDSPASQPSQSSPSSSTSTTAAQSPDQSSQRATGGQQSSGTSIGGSGFLQTAASVVLVVLGGFLVYRGLHK